MTESLFASAAALQAEQATQTVQFAQASGRSVEGEQALERVMMRLSTPEAGRLWGLLEGEPAEAARYGPSQSEVDAQLFQLLVRGGCDDPDLLVEIARSSKMLARLKWEKHKTYLRRTAAWAIQTVRPRVTEDERDAAPARAALPVYSDLQLLAQPDREWLIAGLLPAGGLVEVVGRYGAGKTFLFLDWLMHVASGLAWQGRAVRRGPCLYVYGEGAMKPRVAAWRAAHRVAEGEPVAVTFVPGSVNLLSAPDVGAFIAQFAEQRPAVIALDTLARMTSGGDTNAEDTAGLIVDACDQIQRATGAAVVLGHHTPWDPDKQRPKGNSRVPDCADAVFLLENEAGALTLRCQKMRDGEAPDPLHLKLTPQDGALVVDRGAAAPSAGDRLLALYAEGPQDGLTDEEAARSLDLGPRAVRAWRVRLGPQVRKVSGTGVKGHPARYTGVA